jgi:hypothetical protein
MDVFIPFLNEHMWDAILNGIFPLAARVEADQPFVGQEFDFLLASRTG